MNAIIVIADRAMFDIAAIVLVAAVLSEEASGKEIARKIGQRRGWATVSIGLVSLLSFGCHPALYREVPR